MLKIHESFDGEGRLGEAHLDVHEEGLAFVDGEGTSVLPASALTRIMERYGAPLDPAERTTSVATLELDPSSRLHHIRHLARFDVIARDYLVLERTGEESLCALATTVAAAFGHLARRAREAT